MLVVCSCCCRLMKLSSSCSNYSVTGLEVSGLSLFIEKRIAVASVKEEGAGEFSSVVWIRRKKGREKKDGLVSESWNSSGGSYDVFGGD